MTNSGITENGITYPIAGIDEFTPAQGIQDTAESVDQMVTTTDAHMMQEIAQRPRFIHATTPEQAITESAANPQDIYWVAAE